MFYQLPPAGNPVKLRIEQSASWIEAVFSPYLPRYFSSGTAALAAAISAAVRYKKVSSPEVVLPAYSCPDLISAAVYAGARPVLCDLEPDRPWMNTEQLLTRINSQTVAIVAVHLFGISERMDQLSAIASQFGSVLIEDSAQAFPGGTESSSWDGDLVVLSFGRGKPVNLLGGGAVLYRNESLARCLPKPDAQNSNGHSQWTFFLPKAALYNLMIAPWLYWLPSSLPFLHLGETRFHLLTNIGAMSEARLDRLPANVSAYQADDMWAQKALASMLAELDLPAIGVTDLPRACQIPENRRLLRYPLLVNAESRDRFCAEFRRWGLGPSGMYPTTLPEIPGLAERLAGQGPYPAAKSFAERILTLPTHDRVTNRVIGRIKQVIVSRSYL